MIKPKEKEENNHAIYIKSKLLPIAFMAIFMVSSLNAQNGQHCDGFMEWRIC